MSYFNGLCALLRRQLTRRHLLGTVGVVLMRGPRAAKTSNAVLNGSSANSDRNSLSSLVGKGESPSPSEYIISVLSMGAVGDGITDDGPAFQKAYDLVVSKGGGVVDVPFTANGYRIATTIRLNRSASVRITGIGRLFTTTDVKVFLVTGSHIALESITIDGQQTAGGSVQHLVEANGCNDLRVERCQL